jgi:hypothetical protein
VIDFVRQNPMPAAVPWQEIYLASTNASANQRVRGRPKWCIDDVFGCIPQSFDLIETAAADNSYCWRFIFPLRHAAI